MILRIICLLLFCFFAIVPAQSADLNTRSFAQLPVQRDGRIEPMDSFARYYYKQFYGSVKSTQSPVDWLADLLFNTAYACKQKTFNISHPDVRHALNLPEIDNHLYAFDDVSAAMNAHRDMITSLLNADVKTVTDPAQLQILGLYHDMLTYTAISQSLSLIVPSFTIQHPALAKDMGVTVGQTVSYFDVIPYKSRYAQLAQGVLNNLNQTALTADQINLVEIGMQLKAIEDTGTGGQMQIIPPAWNQIDTTWLSPTQILHAGQGSPQTAALLKVWQAMAVAYRTQDAAAWEKANADALHQTAELAGPTLRIPALQAEYSYNLTHLFALSGLLYALVCILCIVSYRFGFIRRYHIPFIALVAGWVLHTAGLGLRIFILARPPVGTLYESILFVSWIGVAGLLVWTIRSRQHVGIFIAAGLGMSLQVLAPLFAKGGNTLEPLVAVLNTNFWLATHVLAITIGYGCCLITALLAHVYLWSKIRRPDDHLRLVMLSRSIVGAALIALCFATIGTILGGIWADQSWGRFWGWDPKENGALLIVLWLLFILHGKLSGLLHADHFALCAAATIIVVALSWFGVNLLNVGLHSYGFTSGIALYLGLFAGIELIILALCYTGVHYRSGHVR